MAKIDEHIKVMMLKGEPGSNIKSIEKTATSGLVDTYTVTLTDKSTNNFNVTNGSNIQSIEKTSTSGLIDTYTVTLTNGETTNFTVTNGMKGSNIKSIEKTETIGLVDTYTVTLTDDSTTTFTVTNGEGVNTLEIGGRNLLQNSKTFGNFKNRADITLTDGVLSFSTSGSIGTPVQLQSIQNAIAFLRGQNVTISYWVKVRERLAKVADNMFWGAQVSVVYGDGTSSFLKTTPTIETEVATPDSKWRKVQATYQLKDVAITTLTVEFFKRGITGAVDYTRPMLEVSTKPSDWTPAPEDKAEAKDFQTLSGVVSSMGTSNTSAHNSMKQDIEKLKADVSALAVGNFGTFETDYSDCFLEEDIVTKKFGKMRYLSFSLENFVIANEHAKGWYPIIRVGAADKPSVINRFITILYDGSAYKPIESYIDKNGDIKLYTSIDGKGYFRGQLVWFVD